MTLAKTRKRRSRESRYSPRRLEAQQKAVQALELRMAGRRWEEIGKALGYRSHSGAVMAVKTLLDKSSQEVADRHRTLTLERLTKILGVFWPRMLQGNEKATDVVLRTIAQMRQLLGLDAPTKIASVGVHATIGENARKDGFDYDGFSALFHQFLTGQGGQGGNGTVALDAPGGLLDTLVKSPSTKR